MYSSMQEKSCEITLSRAMVFLEKNVFTHADGSKNPYIKDPKANEPQLDESRASVPSGSGSSS